MAKASGNKSIDGRMMVCDDKNGRQKTMQQPNNRSSKGGHCGGGDGDSDGSGGGGGGR